MLPGTHPDMTLGVTITTLGSVPWPILVQQQQLEALRALLLVHKKKRFHFHGKASKAACLEEHDLWVTKQRTRLRKG